ncbi:MAG TPA: hypothetical protein VFO60_03100 [Candidatus Dormibacteraeota bacterium]|nr:hypothetical protein [Candidatus Dormibacteraeota bacterium]
MLPSDVLRVALHPTTGWSDRVLGRRLVSGGAVVAAAGVVAGALSAVATALEPESLAVSGAGYGFSIVLPVLFAGFWLIDAVIVDAVAQTMGAPARLRTWAAASAHAIPLLCGFEVVRVLQALVDRTGAVDLSTAIGFVEFGVIAWFIWVITGGVRAVYDLVPFSAVAAALAPPAAMMALLIVLLLVATVLHIAGAG